MNFEIPKESSEIIDFFESITQNDERDLEIAKKSRKKYLEISHISGKFSSCEDFKKFFDKEIEKFFRENILHSAENKKFLENFFAEKYNEIEDFRRKMWLLRMEERTCEIL